MNTPLKGYVKVFSNNYPLLYRSQKKSLLSYPYATSLQGPETSSLSKGHLRVENFSNVRGNCQHSHRNSRSESPETVIRVVKNRELWSHSSTRFR
jgi:hypothetical protein